MKEIYRLVKSNIYKIKIISKNKKYLFDQWYNVFDH